MKSKSVFSNGFRTITKNWFAFNENVLKPFSLSKNPLDCSILYNWDFDNFILAEKPFEKVLKSLKTCLLVNNNLYEKLFSLLESPTTCDESFKVTSVPFFILDFNLLSCKLDNVTFEVLY